MFLLFSSFTCGSGAGLCTRDRSPSLIAETLNGVEGAEVELLKTCGVEVEVGWPPWPWPLVGVKGELPLVRRVPWENGVDSSLWMKAEKLLQVSKEMNCHFVIFLK